MPRSPGGIEVARLSVRVVPDTSTLLPEIREDLEHIERRLHLEVEVTPDLDGFEEKIETERRQQRRRPVEVPVDPLTDAFAARLNRDVKTIARSVDVGIPVTPEFAGLREKLSARLAEVQSTLRDLRVGVDVSAADRAKLVAELESIKQAADFAIEAKARVDKLSLVKAEAEIDAFRAREAKDVEVDVRVNRDFLGPLVGSAGSGLKKLLGQTTAIARSILLWGVGGVSLLSLLPALVQGVGALSSLAVGLAAILPGALFATAGVLGTLILGFKGLGGAIFETGKRQQEALDSLAPAAKAFALEFKGVFDGIQQEIQQNLFLGLAPRVRAALESLAPVLKGSMLTLVGGINEVFGAGLAAISTDRYAAQFTEFFERTRVLLDALAVSTGPLIDAFSTLGTHVADVVFPRIAGAMVDLSTRFQGFIDRISKNGDLDQFLTRTLDGFSALGQSFGDIGSALKSVFDAASGGQQFDDILLTFQLFTKSISVFLDSPEGAAGLQQFFDSLRQVSAALGPVMGSLFGVVATKVVPIIAQLIEGLAPGVVTFIESLGDALGNLEPVAKPLGAALGGVIAALSPLLGPLGMALASVLRVVADTLVKIAPGVEIFARQLGSVFTEMASSFAAKAPELVNALVLGFANMVAAMPTVVALATEIVRMLPDLLTLAVSALPLLQLGLNLVIAVMPFLIAMMRALEPLLTGLAGSMAGLGGLLVGLQSSFSSLSGSADQAAGASAHVGAALIGVIPFLLSAAGGVDGLRDAMGRANGMIGNTAQNLVGVLAASLAVGRDGVVRLSDSLRDRLVAGFAVSIDWMRRAGGFLNDLGTRSVAGLLGFLDQLAGFLKVGFTASFSIAASAIGSLRGAFSGLVGLVQSALSYLDRLAHRLSTLPGVGIISGLISGIPHFAEGGMTLGPQIAVMGDNPGGREVALPLNSRSTISALSAAMQQARGAGLDAQAAGTAFDVDAFETRLLSALSRQRFEIDGRKVAEVVNRTNTEDAWRR